MFFLIVFSFSLDSNCEALQKFGLILSLQTCYDFLCHKSFTITHNGVDALFCINKTDKCVHMIRHDNIPVDRVSILFKNIKPLVNQIIPINLGEKREPLMARKSYKEHSTGVWYVSFDGH